MANHFGHGLIEDLLSESFNAYGQVRADVRGTLPVKGFIKTADLPKEVLRDGQ